MYCEDCGDEALDMGICIECCKELCDACQSNEGHCFGCQEDLDSKAGYPPVKGKKSVPSSEDR